MQEFWKLCEGLETGPIFTIVLSLNFRLRHTTIKLKEEDKFLVYKVFTLKIFLNIMSTEVCQF